MYEYYITCWAENEWALHRYFAFSLCLFSRAGSWFVGCWQSIGMLSACGASLVCVTLCRSTGIVCEQRNSSDANIYSENNDDDGGAFVASVNRMAHSRICQLNECHLFNFRLRRRGQIFIIPTFWHFYSTIIADDKTRRKCFRFNATKGQQHTIVGSIFDLRKS